MTWKNIFVSASDSLYDLNPLEDDLWDDSMEDQMAGRNEPDYIFGHYCHRHKSYVGPNGYRVDADESGIDEAPEICQRASSMRQRGVREELWDGCDFEGLEYWSNTDKIPNGLKWIVDQKKRNEQKIQEQHNRLKFLDQTIRWRRLDDATE